MGARHAASTVWTTFFAVVLDGDGSVHPNTPSRQMDVSSSSRTDAVESLPAAESIGHGSSADRHADHSAQSQPFTFQGSASGIVEEELDQNKPSRKSSFVAEEVTELPGEHGRESSKRHPPPFSAACSSVADLLSEQSSPPGSLLRGGSTSL